MKQKHYMADWLTRKNEKMIPFTGKSIATSRAAVSPGYTYEPLLILY
jgi:hypothetical protein